MNRVWNASYEQGLRLAKAGCSLPYLDALPGKERSYQRALYVAQLGEYIESYAIDWGTSTGYAIALRVGTDLSRGAIITRRSLVPPWPDHEIDWHCDPEGVLPKSKLKDFAEIIGSRLPGVMNEGRLLYRGRPVEGLWCGYAWTPIPASSPRDKPAMAEIILVDGSGGRVREPIQLTIVRGRPDASRMRESTVSRDLESIRKSR